MAEEQSEKSFTVNDKRFSAQRESSQQSPTADVRSDASSESQQRRDQAAAGTPPTAPQEEAVDFAALLVLLATQASMYLGSIPNPVSQKREKDLPAAKHFIDLLALLQTKTKGNLASEEERLLQQMLFDLRLYYVRETGQ
jgi:hypothetical protein